MKKIGLLVLIVLFSASTLAECNFKKAARNKMLDNKIGVSGKCDVQNATKTQATSAIDDKLNIDSTKMKENGADKKEKVENKISTTKKVVDVVK